MKFSNFLFPASMDPNRDQQVIQETLREARLCDELGMEMLWLAEHHFDGICAYVDPVSFAAALAPARSRFTSVSRSRRCRCITRSAWPSRWR
jgi:alkanesulfonate monooxygenase SsuD/methylene tetrahydromethanopterin reductase-like flavin-dependent oxidoreductase (luciferase family)